jgi:hypothetical protein
MSDMAIASDVGNSLPIVCAIAQTIGLRKRLAQTSEAVLSFVFSELLFVWSITRL